MDTASRVAFVQAQTVCAMAELAAMHAANRAREEQGKAHAYGEDEFRAVPDTYQIGWNAVLTYLRD